MVADGRSLDFSTLEEVYEIDPASCQTSCGSLKFEDDEILDAVMQEAVRALMRAPSIVVWNQ